MAKNPTPEEIDRKYREEYDARTLANAASIQADPARMRGAVAGAKRLQAEEEKRLKEQQAAQAALKKVADGKVGAKPAAKKAASRPAKKVPTAKRAPTRGGKRGGR